jgi:hypothetical protein
MKKEKNKITTIGYKQDNNVLDKAIREPHYVNFSAILLDGKIWKWKVGISNNFFGIDYKNMPKKYNKINKKVEKRFSVFDYSIWVDNLKEHNEALKKRIEIYKLFPIHENIIGEMPY